MKTLRPLGFLPLTALVAAFLLAIGCSAQEKKDDAKASAASPPATEVAATNAATAAAAISAADSWDTVKNYTYEQRGDFAAGLNHMAERLDASIVRLQARRATLPQTSAKDWDFAMKELNDARSDLRFQIGELDKATPETWNDVKDKLAQAWQRTKDAFDKVRTSTTT